jgi:hypothetical protein
MQGTALDLIWLYMAVALIISSHHNNASSIHIWAGDQTSQALNKLLAQCLDCLAATRGLVQVSSAGSRQEHCSLYPEAISLTPASSGVVHQHI